MSIYAIGDVQGCYQELMKLLDLIQLNPQQDQLWFTGDLVNRGPQSLEVLRFVKNLGSKAITVLGNHDLHYLAVASGAVSIKKTDTFQDIIGSKEAKELLEWMRFRPLMHYDAGKNFLLIHAGIAPTWDITTALVYAHEVEEILRGSNYFEFLKNMYKNSSEDPQKKFNSVINYFTRMRYINQEGDLELVYKNKESTGEHPENYYPWFKMTSRLPAGLNVLFGHWAALEGKTETPHRFALDTGCCWGNALTALRLEDFNYFSVKCNYSGVNDDERL
jgi:bis(5'-nucleosyl)-tetraphosphatase (symmetrical)